MVEEKRMWDWKREPKAEALVRGYLKSFYEKAPFLKKCSELFLEKASVDLFDCIDHFTLGKEQSTQLQEAGFTEGEESWEHQGALLPRVRLSKDDKEQGVYLAVESIESFLMVHKKTVVVEGSPFSAYRVANLEDGFFLVERRQVGSFKPEKRESKFLEDYFYCQALWQTRPREGLAEDKMLKEAHKRAEKIVSLLGPGEGSSLVFTCERAYWQARNAAGALQKHRQDSVGIGWANHDHHTFRSSREHFPQLVSLMKALGFHCRERFYAGEEAGWGAQVMENSACGIVLFLDVDLAKEEVAIDFSQELLAPLPKLGTIGLWCALHGDSILQAGMHHLEAQFCFSHLRDSLKKCGIETMKPFSDFPYLRQAFTKGELWEVAPRRVELLLKKEWISKEAAERFLQEGAMGSHLENLERKEGFKGFNQKNVSNIITRLDLRKEEIS